MHASILHNFAKNITGDVSVKSALPLAVLQAMLTEVCNATPGQPVMGIRMAGKLDPEVVALLRSLDYSVTVNKYNTLINWKLIGKI